MKLSEKIEERRKRVKIANDFINVIGLCGRNFFTYKGSISKLEVDDRGRIWYIDRYSLSKIYLHYPYWKANRKISVGGTLTDLIGGLKDFVFDGSQINPPFFGPWPDWMCSGDLWGYEDDMEIVRRAAYKMGIICRIHKLKGPQP